MIKIENNLFQLIVLQSWAKGHPINSLLDECKKDMAEWYQYLPGQNKIQA